MNVIEHEMNISASEPAVIIPISDTHIGHAGTEVSQIKKLVNWIKKQPNARVVLLGDIIDAISLKDPRFEMDSIHPDFQGEVDNLHWAEIRATVKLFKPIKNQLIASLSGNHEGSIKKHYSIDAHEIINELLGIPHLTDPGFVRLKLKRSKTSAFKFDMWCTHGLKIGGGRKLGSKVNNLTDTAADFDADLYMGGHSHTLFEVADEYIGLNKVGYMVARRQHYVNTGTFQQTYKLNDDREGWAQQKAFKPARTGTARINILLNHDAERGYYIDSHVYI